MILAAFKKAAELPAPEQQFMLMGLVGFFALLVSLPVYLRLFLRVRQNGGLVRTEHFNPGDLFTAISLIFILLLVAFPGSSSTAKEALAPKREITAGMIISGGLFYIILAAGTCSFLASHRISVVQTLGLSRVWLKKAPVRAIALVAAIFPALMLANLLMMLFLGPSADQQELVILYKNAFGQGRFDIVAAIVCSATILAPLSEEFLFRGYIYPTLKRYVGPIPSAIFVSVLFGAVHGNLLNLPSLVILALGLTLAYEWSGSLLVPILMHVVFNGTNLLHTWAQNRYGIDL